MMRFFALIGLVIVLALGPSDTGSAMLAGGKSATAPPPADQMTALLATTCNNCWADAGAFVATAPTIQSVIWNCTSLPCPGGGPLASTIFGSDSEGPSAIITNWSSGVFDTINNQLLIWGGGHQGYWGNEVYGFSTKNLTWSRLSVPGIPPGNVASVDTCTFSSGTQPASMHTYGGPTFMAVGGGKMFMTNGGGSGPSGTGCQLSWIFDIQTATWTQVNNINANGGPGFISAWDSSTHNVYVASEDNNGFQFFPSNGTGTPTLLGGAQIDDFHMSGALDPIDHLMVTFSGVSGHLEVFNTTTGAKTTPTSSGGAARICETSTSVASAGIAWDSAISKFVAWCGNGGGGAGGQIFTLTPVTWVWAQIGPGVGNTVTPPTAPQVNGTWGHLGYDVLHNCLVLVNAWTEHVFVFKLSP